MVARIDKRDEFAPEPDAARGGGASAWQFRLAVLRYHKLIYRFAYSLLADRHEAEDVTQETFLRYWERGAGVRAPKEWLLTVARNGCFDRQRKSWRTIEAEPKALDAPSEEPGPAVALERREIRARLQGLVSALPEPQRTLVVLFDVHGLDGGECARILGLSANQVKVYLHRARRRLRRELERSP